MCCVAARCSRRSWSRLGGERIRARRSCTTTPQRTWASFVAMTDPRSGLPADILESDGSHERADVDDEHRRLHVERGRRAAARASSRARELRRGCRARSTTLERMERYADTGQFYNWYDHRTGAKLDVLAAGPERRLPSDPLVGRQRLARGRAEDRREQRARARARARGRSTTAMDFGFYYGPSVNRVLFHYRPDDPAASPCCYDTVVSESRIVDYLGIGRGQLPPKEYFGRWRTFPDTCDYSFQETKPVGDCADLLRRRGLRGRLPLPRHARSCRRGAARCSRR